MIRAWLFRKRPKPPEPPEGGWRLPRRFRGLEIHDLPENPKPPDTPEKKIVSLKDGWPPPWQSFQFPKTLTDSILEGIHRLGDKRSPAHLRLDQIRHFHIRQFVLALYHACKKADAEHIFVDGLDSPLGRLFLEMPFATLFPVVEGDPHKSFRKPALRLLALSKKRRQRGRGDADENTEEADNGGFHENSSCKGVVWRHNRYMRGRRPARRGLSGIDGMEGTE
jgi:hypothetical protein